ncbi:Phosphodiesterase [Aphelenchoides fujianensis]|nr:Phosphodiesterase [Aphelenchoides fujianensis]
MRSHQPTRSPRNRIRRATTALRSACDWLCCAGSSARGDPQQQSEVPRSTHAAYEVVDSAPITLSRPSDGTTAINNSTGSSHGGVPDSMETAVLRQEFGEIPLASERLDRLPPTNSAPSTGHESGRRVVLNHHSTHISAAPSAFAASRKPSATISADIPYAPPKQPKFHKSTAPDPPDRLASISAVLEGPTTHGEKSGERRKPPTANLIVGTWSPRTDATSSADDTSTIETLDAPDTDRTDANGWQLFELRSSPNSQHYAPPSVRISSDRKWRAAWTTRLMSGRELYRRIDDAEGIRKGSRSATSDAVKPQTKALGREDGAAKDSTRYVTTVHVGSTEEPKHSPTADMPVSLLVNGNMADDAASSSSDSSRSYRRKGSLMPPITEQDLRSTDLGHRDPVSVAQVFGADFASQFCVPFEMSGQLASAPPFTLGTAEKFLRLRSTADEAGASGAGRENEAPTIKMRVRRAWTDERKAASLSSFEDRSALPVKAAVPSIDLPSTSGLSSESSTSHLPLGDFHDQSAGCARENSDFLQFQRSFISWIKTQTDCFGCAFILRSSENNLAICRISEDEQLFADGAGTIGLVEALGFRPSEAHTMPEQKRETHGPKVCDIRKLEPDISNDLFYLADQIHRQSMAEGHASPDRNEIEASLCGVMSTSGFVTTLIVAHQNKESRQQELDALLPLLPMIGSLTASVCNLEEQRRLANLSQMILDRTQRVSPEHAGQLSNGPDSYGS